MSLTAAQILAIDPLKPERLFTQGNYQSEFNKLRLTWHPDRCPHPDADQVFSRIGALFDAANNKIDNNSWEIEGELTFVAAGKKYKFNYLKMHETDVGKTYIAHNKVAFIYDKSNSDLFTKAHRTIDSIKFETTKFKDEFDRFLPTNSYRKFNSDIGHVLLVDKTPDVVSLQDLLTFMPGNKLDPKHVAWIISSTINLLAFFEHIGICHNAITTESIYVSPKYHSVCILGGWGFSATNEGRIVAVPKKLRSVLPNSIFVDKTAKTIYDQYGLKSLAIECLGDSSLVGSKLLMNKAIPTQLIHWLRQPPTQSAKKEYTDWMTVLKQAYGVRKFHKFEKDITNIYEEK